MAKKYQPVPDAERCECCTSGMWSMGRCDRRAKHTVLAQKWTYSEQAHSEQAHSDPREIRVCGVHRNQANKGKRLLVYTGPRARGSGAYGSVSFEHYQPEATEFEKIKAELANAESRQRWDSRKPESARNAAGRAMFEQAPKILEMLFMVAERGDQRAWAAIKTIQDGMSEVEKADAEYQALVDKIEALKAKIEQARGEQA